jgi:hypothetical protein
MLSTAQIITVKDKNNIFPEKNEVQNIDDEIKHHIHSASKQLVREWKLQYTDSFIIVKILTNNKFSFYDSKDTIIGHFTIDDIIKYVTQTSNNSSLQPIALDNTTKKLIESTICENAQTDNCKLKLSSPFMNDIEILIELNKMLKTYEETTMKQLITNNITNNMDHSTNKIKIFIHKIAEHTLNIITFISKKIKHDDNEKLKSKLLRYSIGLVYRLSQYVSTEILDNEKNFNDLLKTVDELKSLEVEIKDKLDTIKK